MNATEQKQLIQTQQQLIDAQQRYINTLEQMQSIQNDSPNLQETILIEPKDILAQQMIDEIEQVVSETIQKYLPQNQIKH